MYQKKTVVRKKESSSNSADNSNGEKYATVLPGQGVYRVATNAGISESELLRLNNLTSESQIHPGQKLRVR
ncbi:LysM peptidoglycan-binding domain-containing protein [Apilactobacillus ozensis]|uniref:LysM peptidoglycan-binding domain-containing protein n=1 Tax=Apilactobacillus ozensis TaxID=866801 RepID=UPI0006CFE759|nr:LysM domain-containing protein [Apilactobacillus ozensis]